MFKLILTLTLALGAFTGLSIEASANDNPTIYNNIVIVSAGDDNRSWELDLDGDGDGDITVKDNTPDNIYAGSMTNEFWFEKYWTNIKVDSSGNLVGLFQTCE